MKRRTKVLWALLVVLVSMALFLYVYCKSLAPDYEGDASINRLSHTTNVYFDDYGIPHIFAENETDAQRVLGYVHAQDRLWQMEILRRIAPGRLSELFGSKLLKTDRFFAATGIAEYSKKSVAELDPNSESYRLAMAYVDGINQYMEQGDTPIEFTLLGIEKKPFTLEDVYNVFGFMSFSFAMAQKTDPLLTDIRDRYGMSYLDDFGLDGSSHITRLKTAKGKTLEFAAISRSVSALLETSPTPAFIGSNSWVIGGSKTKSGKVIFENDPHIGFSQPATWYEAHIHTPGHEMYGFYLAGTPFPLLGHNRSYAYGLTMFENDDLDLFHEKENAHGQYLTPEGYKNYTTRIEKIKVKDSADVTLKVKISRHGPLVNGVLDGVKKEMPVALSWLYTQHPNKLLEATYRMSHARNHNDFATGVSLIHAPGLNVMYGDAGGNIAWIAAGKLYRQKPSVNPNFILKGEGDDDWKEYLDFSKNPGAVNPESGFVYSANNQHEAIDGYLYPGYYLPHDRATRIESLLKAKNNWTAADVERMTLDHTSVSALPNVRHMLASLSGIRDDRDKEAITLLRQWKGTNSTSEAAPVLYNKWLYFYLKNTMEDELGKENFELLIGTHIVKQMIERQLANPSSPWWDDIRTKKRETRSEILTRSFHEAMASLTTQLGTEMSGWKWGDVHQLEHPHPLGALAIFRPFFNVGPAPVSGSNEVIDNQLFLYSDDAKHTIKAGPSTRRVIDFSNIENSRAVLPTGESGVFTSPHYDDQAALYVEGKFRPMLLNEAKIKSLRQKMQFSPKR